MIAMISDIHANLEALVAVLDDIRKHGIKKIYCCGDIVGYGANPNECIELVRANKIESVLGNHDYGIVGINKNCLNLGEKALYGDKVVDVLDWTKEKLTKENYSHLSALKCTLNVGDVLLVHGSPRDPLFTYVDFPQPSLIPEDIRVLVMGHTHVPFIKYFNEKLAINPGSVGQPRDSDKRASYCIFKGDDAEIIRVEYDIDGAAKKIKEAGFPGEYGDRLFCGI